MPTGIRRALEIEGPDLPIPGVLAYEVAGTSHHIQHWADGGATSLENLILLCTYHHRLMHEGGFQYPENAASAGTTSPNTTGVR